MSRKHRPCKTLSVAETCRNQGNRSGGFLLGQPVERGVEDGIRGRARLVEVDVGFVHAEVRRQALALDRFPVGGQVAGIREPEAAAIREPHELLDAGPAERALADQLRALVAFERGRRRAPRRPTCRS